MNVSAKCFNSRELKGWALDHQAEGACELSNDNELVIDIADLQDFFINIFSLFILTESGGAPLDKIIQDDWKLFSDDRYCRPIIDYMAAELFPSYAPSKKVIYRDDVFEPSRRWSEIKQQLRVSRRFFSGDLISDEDQWDVFFQSNNILAKGGRLYRGRINKDPAKFFTNPVDLGIPPAKEARAGRANVSGIPYLYLATNRKTVMYECRALAGDHISIAEFSLLRDVDVVDFTSKPDLFSAFLNSTQDFLTTVQRYLFLSKIGKDLSRPVRRYDNQDLDYLPTQFICEYIRLVTLAKGMVFESSQYAKGNNVVLFDADDVIFSDVQQKIVGEVMMSFLDDPE